MDSIDSERSLFYIGQQVVHKLFHYRGLVFDVDPEFSGEDRWYEQMAITRPPRDRPWYHILVHEADYTTYVAERNLCAYEGNESIQHPLLLVYFDDFRSGVYHPRRTLN